MPVLKNPKHEAFAQGLAKGMTQGEAYTKAGYSAAANSAGANSSRLLKDDRIASRVKELQERSAERAVMSISKLTEMFLEDRRLAYQVGQAGAAVSAGTAIGKLHGLFVDRSINETVHYVVRAPEPAKTIEGWLEGRKQINGGKE